MEFGGKFTHQQRDNKNNQNSLTMKKVLVVLLVLFAFVISANALVRIKPKVTTWDQIPGFMANYEQMLKLNRGRFVNLNKIQIGDTVLVPSKSGIGVEGWIAEKPVTNNGQHDCLWLINQKYLLGQLKTQPVDTIKVKKSKTIPPLEKPAIDTIAEIMNWFLLLVVVALIACFLYYVFKRIFKKSAVVNPHVNPVITGGLSDEPAVALEQITAAYPNRPRALKVQTVIIEGPEGVNSARVQMTFSDGVHTSTLKPGEMATRVEREGGVIDFYRQHCGNLFGEIYQGGYNLPEGWTWKLVGVDYVIPTEEEAAAAADDISQALELEKAKEVVSTPNNITLSISEVSAEDIVKVINALKGSELNIDHLKYGDLKIKFLTIKKKG